MASMLGIALSELLCEEFNRTAPVQWILTAHFRIESILPATPRKLKLRDFHLHWLRQMHHWLPYHLF